MKKNILLLFFIICSLEETEAQLTGGSDRTQQG